MIDRAGPRPLIQESLVLRFTGVPTRLKDGATGDRFMLNPMSGWRPLADDRLYAVEAACVRLHDALAARIFGDLKSYYALLPL